MLWHLIRANKFHNKFHPHHTLLCDLHSLILVCVPHCQWHWSTEKHAPRVLHRVVLAFHHYNMEVKSEQSIIPPRTYSCNHHLKLLPIPRNLPCLENSGNNMHQPSQFGFSNWKLFIISTSMDICQKLCTPK